MEAGRERGPLQSLESFMLASAAAPAAWHVQPLFASSTLRAFQAERDVLRQRVLPAIQEWLP